MTHHVTAKDVPELRADMVADAEDFTRRFPQYHSWAPSLRVADLFWVAEDMRKLAEASIESMPEYTVNRDDLPAPNGVMVWEGTVDGAAGIAWKTVGDKLCFTVLVPRATALYLLKEALGPGSEKEVQRVGRSPEIRSALFSELEMPLPFGKTIRPGYVRVGTTIGSSKDSVWMELMPRMMIASWLLLNEVRHTSEIVRPSRAGMKRLARLDASLLMNTRYVTLRRTNPVEYEGSGMGPGVQYSVRWVVKQHDRWIDDKDNPGQKRKVTVRAHIKGPDGAPILDPDRLVNVLRK